MDPRLVIRFGEKVLRAAKHLKGLEETAERWVEEHGDPGFHCVGDLNSQRTKYLLRVQGRVEFPEVEWGIIIGDAVHCLRSALDQLVSGLCTEAPSARTQFPVCRTQREWIVDAPGMYWSIPAAYVAVLDRAQPYHRGDAAHMHPLAILNALSNLDKHRAVPATALVPSRIKIIDIETRGCTIGEFRPCTGTAIEDGAVIAEAKFTHDGITPDPDVRVNPHLVVNVGFGVIDKASLISGKPVGKTFHDVLIPAVKDILEDAVAVQDGPP